MSKKKNNKKEFEKKSKKKNIVYVVLRALIIICLVRQVMHGNMQNAFLCVLSLLLFLLPDIIERKFKIDIPVVLESIIYVFIFSAEILGEINNFYGNIPIWDTILHTTNGFLCASIGFSLIYLLNEKMHLIKLSPLFVALVSFCFSMTVGVVWEMFEEGMDNYFKTDMQKDEYIYTIRTVTLDPDFSNKVITIDDIDHTIIYDKDDNELVTLEEGYLDIGLYDTMMDLKVNFLGAVVFSIFGYLFIVNEKKYKMAGNFMTKKRKG